jgi:hypothetical protein
MSIFITNLAFVGQPELVTSSKMAIFLASLTAGVAGYLWLQAFGKPLASDENVETILVRPEVELRVRFKIGDVTHELRRMIQRVPKHQLKECLECNGLSLPENLSGNIKFIE